MRGRLGAFLAAVTASLIAAAPAAAQTACDPTQTTPQFRDQVPELSGTAPQPRDPALERIFPTANREDEQVAAEFRRLTEDGLRARKTANLTTAITALSGVADQKVSLEQPEALALLIALTDVRLVLGERLGLRRDDDVELLEEQVSGLPRDDPAVYALAVYDFLTWLQETLATAMLPGDPGTA